MCVEAKAADVTLGALYNFAIAVIAMEEIKDNLTFKGVADRLTLGITRILGVYSCGSYFETST